MTGGRQEEQPAGQGQRRESERPAGRAPEGGHGEERDQRRLRSLARRRLEFQQRHRVMERLNGQHRAGERGQRERERDAHGQAARQKQEDGQADAEGQDLQQSVRRAGLAFEHDALQEHGQPVGRSRAQPHVDVVLTGDQVQTDPLWRLSQPDLDDRGRFRRPGHGQRDGRGGGGQHQVERGPPTGEPVEMDQRQARDGESVGGASGAPAA